MKQTTSIVLQSSRTSNHQTKLIMKTIRLFILLAVIATAATVQASTVDPRTNSWLTAYSGQYARIYTTDVNKKTTSKVHEVVLKEFPEDVNPAPAARN